MPRRSSKTQWPLKSPADAANLPFFTKAQLATAAAWSPDPKNPPLYFDLAMKDDVPQPDVVAKWTANAPLAFIDQYIDNLRGTRDRRGCRRSGRLRFDTKKLHEILDTYDIQNSFEMYHGTHTAPLPTASRITCFRSSARTCARRRMQVSMFGTDRCGERKA